MLDWCSVDVQQAKRFMVKHFENDTGLVEEGTRRWAGTIYV